MDMDLNYILLLVIINKLAYGSAVLKKQSDTAIKSDGVSSNDATIWYKYRQRGNQGNGAKVNTNEMNDLKAQKENMAEAYPRLRGWRGKRVIPDKLVMADDDYIVAIKDKMDQNRRKGNVAKQIADEIKRGDDEKITDEKKQVQRKSNKKHIRWILEKLILLPDGKTSFTPTTDEYPLTKRAHMWNWTPTQHQRVALRKMLQMFDEPEKQHPRLWVWRPLGEKEDY